MDPIIVNVKTLSGDILILEIVPKEGFTESATITHELARLQPEFYPIDRTCVFEVSPGLYGVLVLPSVSVQLVSSSKRVGRDGHNSVFYRFNMNFGSSSFEQREDPIRPGTDHECSLAQHGLPYSTHIVVYTEPNINEKRYSVQHQIGIYMTGCTDGEYDDDHLSLDSILERCRHCVERNGRAYCLTSEAKETILRLIRLHPC